MSDEEVKAYFLARVLDTNNPDVCWPWQGSLNEAGYGMAFVRHGSIRASHLAYELFIGPIPTGLHILHDPVKCTTRACVNPAHLRCGTNYENVQDRFISDTQPYGEGHYNTNFVNDDIREIRRLYVEEGWTLEQIATLKQSDLVTIQNIIKAKTWKHVDAGTYMPPPDQRRKLSHDDVELILALRRQSSKLADIAARLNNRVTIQQISRICKKYGL